MRCGEGIRLKRFRMLGRCLITFLLTPNLVSGQSLFGNILPNFQANLDNLRSNLPNFGRRTEEAGQESFPFEVPNIQQAVETIGSSLVQDILDKLPNDRPIDNLSDLLRGGNL